MHAADVVDHLNVIASDNANDRILKTFIEAYENQPQLWNVSSALYTSKSKRNEGLAKLLHIYKQLKPDATIGDVRKKINTLRSNCRREFNKIKASKSSGTGSDNVYTPTSWVFYALSFIHDIEVPVSLTSEEDEINTQDLSETPQTNSIEVHDDFKVVRSSLSSLTSGQPPRKKQHQMGRIATQNKLLSLACKYFSEPRKTEPDDSYLDIAKVWATKLKDLDPIQRKFAEKAVNDVLFEADMGTLNRDSVQINHRPPNFDATNNSVSVKLE